MQSFFISINKEVLAFVGIGLDSIHGAYLSLFGLNFLQIRVSGLTP